MNYKSMSAEELCYWLARPCVNVTNLERAMCASMSTEDLAEIAKDADPFIRNCVAANAATPSHVLVLMFEVEDNEYVKARLFNRLSSGDVVDILTVGE